MSRTLLGRRGAGDKQPVDTAADPAVTDEPSIPDTDVRLQGQWTGGSALATKAATAGLWACLVCGPIGAAVGVLAVAGQPAAATPVAAAATDSSAEQAAVSEFAQRFVTTWLTTARGNETALDTFINTTGLRLAQVPSTVTDPATSSITRTATGDWAVTVAATVTGPSAGGEAPTSGRQFFLVAVHYDGGSLIAPTLPAPVAAPTRAQPPSLDYPYTATPSDPVAVATGEFLSALLAGVGDVTRYVTPGVDIAAIQPAPYVAVDQRTVRVDQELGEDTQTPTTGDTLRVLTTADVTSPAGQVIAVQYALTLTAREGRWEVTAIDPSPAQSTSAPQPSATTATSTAPNTSSEAPPAELEGTP
ncbi:conjugal transfer protein [Klenkia sp. PcliD-1-E]|uniref:conjugal transfer protein n=1 Tax=Klenkia sp. PcliD-1-E TaxID=2954492 RepID=UPI002098082C|nr:conjugal transfer protein [Klenkia sp. PcliD-1-E]MCO7219527.1 conjugal transfer protein [Klenkia sp. PcliD-1-E]